MLKFAVKASLSRTHKNTPMGRNNEKNIKKHNDKLHKAQDKAKQAKMDRKKKLASIIKKHNESNNPKGE